MSPSPSSTGSPSATAFVPAHVTGIFTVHRDDDPSRSGSRGAGLALEAGVTVEITPAETTTVLVNGEPTAVEAVDRVLDSLGVDAEVEVDAELPLGSGFGLSGAMALGSALASNAGFDLGNSENDLIEVAHVAEVEAGTGLGDVVAAARGGTPIRLEPGAPPHGTLDGIPGTARVEVLTSGGLSTPAILEDRPERITEAGERALEELLDRPTLPRFLEQSRAFARDTGLLTEDVLEVIEAVEDTGGRASMGMLGRTVMAFGTDLSEAGFDPVVTRIHPGGASILEEPGWNDSPR
ncbi:MAG: pantoate kinase [Halodesulfurarchaeum sp.]